MVVINVATFPKGASSPRAVTAVIEGFSLLERDLRPGGAEPKGPAVYLALRPQLLGAGFDVADRKGAGGALQLSTRRGSARVRFDAWHPEERVALSVQAGRGSQNNQCLRAVVDGACSPVVAWVITACLNEWKGRHDFLDISSVLDSLLNDPAVGLPLEGVVLVGY